MTSCSFPLRGFDFHSAQSLTPQPVFTGHAEPMFTTCFSCLFAAKQLQWELFLCEKPKASLFQIGDNGSTKISFRKLDICCFKPRADLLLCSVWKCLVFPLMLRGDILFIYNSVFSVGKVSHMTFYSSPGRIGYVWDSVTKVCITICDLQVLGCMKEY